MKRLIVALSIVLLAMAGVTTAHADGARHFNPPKQYYLALGDSLAFGFQLAKFYSEVGTGSYDPGSFNTGYVDDFAQMLRTAEPGIQTVNYSCVGETTATFINGGCPFHSASLPLHNDYPLATSQLTAAVAFLHAHPGKVSPITIDLGSNDLQALSASCAGSLSCIGAGLAQVQVNLTTILGALRAASPSSEIIVLNNVDPYEYLNPASVPLFGALNGVIAAAASENQAFVADIFTPALGFSQAYFSTLTNVYGPLGDVHPTDAGYSIITQYVWAASGYARLNN